MLSIWTTVAPLSSARGELAGALGADGKIYAIGGTTSTFGDGTATVRAYTTGDNFWSPRASLHTRRSEHAAAAGLDGRIYAFGGFNTTSGILRSVEAYNANNTWTFVASLHTARGELAGATGADGKIYAIGGNTTRTTAGASAVVERYTPGQNVWATVAPLHTARSAPAAAAGPNGKIYVFGGLDAAGNVLNTVECYSPFTNKWIFVAHMPTARAAAAAVQGPNGRLFVLGGATADIFGPPTNVVESYNPDTDTWSTVVPPMPTARSWLAAVTGDDGHIYAIGGDTGNAPGTPTLRVVEALSATGGFAAGPAVKSPATVTSDVTSGTLTSVTLTVSPLLEATNQWVVPSSRTGDGTTMRHGTEPVTAVGGETLAADVTDAVFAGGIA